MIDLDLTGRRAVVTGASAGIGEATVEVLADLGARVDFCARGADGVERLGTYQSPGGGSVVGHVADMGDRQSTEGFIDAVLADGGVDILVNNVGASPSRNFQYMTDEDWQDLHELNLMSAVRCTRAFLPGMRANGWGRVVMIATGAAFYPGAALIDYAATKLSLIHI